MCNNGIFEEGEQCDGTPHCDPITCTCQDGYIPDPAAPGYCKAAPYCGDGNIDPGEECEISTPKFCLNCKCVDGTIPDPTNPGYCITPFVSIEKLINDQDADTSPGPVLLAGSPVTWTYMVTNTHNSAVLTNITVTDSDLTVKVECPDTKKLEPGKSMTCTALGVARLGQYHNVGYVVVTASNGVELSSSDPSYYVGVSELLVAVDITPDTLNLKSKSDKNAITAYIELPKGYNVNQIDVKAVELYVDSINKIPAQFTPTSVGDYDQDGIPDLMVKFERQALIGKLGGMTGMINLTVSGKLYNGVGFTGCDTIRVINPGK